MKNQNLIRHRAVTKAGSGKRLSIGLPDFLVMTGKYIIPFIAFICLLIISEYFLLQEIYSRQRAGIIAISIAGLLASVILFSLFYKKYRKSIK